MTKNVIFCLFKSKAVFLNFVFATICTLASSSTSQFHQHFVCSFFEQKLCAAFMYLHFMFVLFGAKTALKMLVKLTPGLKALIVFGRHSFNELIDIRKSYDSRVLIFQLSRKKLSRDPLLQTKWIRFIAQLKKSCNL